MKIGPLNVRLLELFLLAEKLSWKLIGEKGITWTWFYFWVWSIWKRGPRRWPGMCLHWMPIQQHEIFLCRVISLYFWITVRFVEIKEWLLFVWYYMVGSLSINRTACLATFRPPFFLIKWTKSMLVSHYFFIFYWWASKFLRTTMQ